MKKLTNETVGKKLLRNTSQELYHIFYTVTFTTLSKNQKKLIEVSGNLSIKLDQVVIEQSTGHQSKGWGNGVRAKQRCTHSHLAHYTTARITPSMVYRALAHKNPQIRGLRSAVPKIYLFLICALFLGPQS